MIKWERSVWLKVYLIVLIVGGEAVFGAEDRESVLAQCNRSATPFQCLYRYHLKYHHHQQGVTFSPETQSTNNNDNCGTLEENDDLRSKVPWVAGVFARGNSKQQFKFLVTGTVLSPNVVLTVFAGAYGEPNRKVGKYFISPPVNHLIAVGLKSNNLQDVDAQTQFAEVSRIVPYSGHEPENKQFHIFLFHLKTALKLDTPYVKAACLPDFGKKLTATKLEARQGGFASYPNGSSDLKMVSVNIGTDQYCTRSFQAFYKGNSECGRVTDLGSDEPACALHGSAAVIPVYNNKWFVAGIGATGLIPSVKSASQWCKKDATYFHDRSKQTLEWLSGNIRCAETSQYSCGDGTCISWDNVCNEKSDCKNGNMDEDPIFCRALKPCIFSGRTYECGIYGACIYPNQVCDGKRDCRNGEDEVSNVCVLKHWGSGSTERPLNQAGAPERPRPTPTYRPLPPKPPQFAQASRPSRPSSACSRLEVADQAGVSVRCSNRERGEEVPCTEAGVNTVAKLDCKRYYKSTSRLPSAEMTCQADGSWKPYRPFGCEPDCGILSSRLTAFVVSGQEATRHDAFPWHATLYLRKNNEYHFICGGSLIEKNVLITAAHCVSDSTGALVPTYNLKIVLGAVASNYMQNVESPNSQLFNAKDVWVPGTYDRRSLQSDISIIQLDKDADFGEYVRPVCYLSQTSSSGLPAPGRLGKVPGFGFVDAKNIAESLQFAAFPVIAPDECVKSLKRIPPLSTFCAGYKNGTSVCQGDSGGGMTFPEQTGSVTRYFLRGLVSHGEVKEGKRCDPDNYVVFTHVDAFADWILQRLEGLLRA